MGTFRHVLNNQTHDGTIIINLNGDTIPSSNNKDIFGISKLSYQLHLTINEHNLYEATHKIQADGQTFEGTTTRHIPQSERKLYDIIGYSFGIMHTFSVWNKPDVQLQSHPGDAPRYMWDEVTESLNEILSIIKNQLDICFFVPAMRGFDKRFYDISKSNSTGLHNLEGVTRQAEAVADDITSKHEIQGRISKLVKQMFPDIDRRGNRQGMETEVVSVNQFGEYNIVGEGFGLNQLVCLFYYLVIAKSGSTLFIEEPEISLHPKSQIELCSILTEIASGERKQLIVTTHSEHILLGLLQKVMEKKLDANDVRVYYFEKENEITKVTPLKVYENGEIEGGLKGFFEADMEHINKFLENFENTRKRDSP